jgi:hypothetical protein
MGGQVAHGETKTTKYFGWIAGGEGTSAKC